MLLFLSGTSFVSVRVKGTAYAPVLSSISLGSFPILSVLESVAEYVYAITILGIVILPLVRSVFNSSRVYELLEYVLPSSSLIRILTLFRSTDIDFPSESTPLSVTLRLFIPNKSSKFAFASDIFISLDRSPVQLKYGLVV